MTENEIITANMIVLACYGAYAGKLPRGMFQYVMDGLKGKRWDSADELMDAAELLAEAFLVASGVTDSRPDPTSEPLN